MAKKSKEWPINMKSDIASNSDSGSSDIFKTIFGDISQEKASLSIFSHDNPFRRKPSDRSETPQQLGLGLGSCSAEAIENPSSGGSEKNELVDVKKRKRNKEKKYSVYSDSLEGEAPLETKKPKKEKGKRTNYGNESNVVSQEDEEENPNLNSEINVKSKKDKGENPNLGSKSKGVEEKDEGKNPALGLESNGMSKKEGKNPNVGSNSNEMLNKGKGKTPYSGFESKEMAEKGKGQNPKLGVELNDTVNLEIERKDGDDKVKGKKKKKRKREELEREYEVKHYGVAVEAEAKGEEGGVGGIVVGEKRKMADNPPDMLVSKEGFDDESKLLRTVFVGNLPLKVKKEALLKEFSQFGEIESLRIRSVPIMDTKTPRKGAIMKKQINDSVGSVHAYIVFKTEQSAQASLAHNMAVVGGNHIRVDRACPPQKKLKGENASLYDNKRTVFVGNLPFDVKDEEIYQLFCGINQLESSIEAVRIIRDCHSSVGKGIAYVLFKTRDAANLVVKKRNLKLRDRDLRLSHARSDTTPAKRKNPSTAWTGNSLAKKLALDSRTRSDSNSRVKTKSATSYQGLRASKSGVQKKVHKKSTEPVKLKSKNQKGEQVKEHKTKRPAVAARKANALKGGSASKLAGKKRKLESQTPEGSHRNKKAKKFW